VAVVGRERLAPPIYKITFQENLYHRTIRPVDFLRSGEDRPPLIMDK